MSKARGRCLDGRLFHSPGQGSSGAGSRDGSTEFRGGKEVNHVSGTSVNGKGGGAARQGDTNLLAKMMEPGKNRLRDEPL